MQAQVDQMHLQSGQTHLKIVKRKPKSSNAQSLAARRSVRGVAPSLAALPPCRLGKCIDPDQGRAHTDDRGRPRSLMPAENVLLTIFQCI